MIALREAPRRGSSKLDAALTARALFLTNFLSKRAILGELPSRRAGVHHLPYQLCSGLSSQPRRLLTSIYAGAFSSPAPEARGRLLIRRRGDPYTDWLLPLPPRRRPMDRGILAQQSDVRCKRGRLGGIMIAPAAHTSKGLAKAFVASAGGKGPENRDTPAPLSPTLRGARSRSSLPFRRGSLHPGHFLPL